jgi:hypothetical protein
MSLPHTISPTTLVILRKALTRDANNSIVKRTIYLVDLLNQLNAIGTLAFFIYDGEEAIHHGRAEAGPYADCLVGRVDLNDV